jgi:secreted repeat protein with Y-X4-D motif
LVFIDGNHRALYTFDNDKPDTSSCYGECAAAWPPYLANAHAKIGLLLRAWTAQECGPIGIGRSILMGKTKTPAM